MKTKFFKYGVLLMAAMLCGAVVKAQDANEDDYSNYQDLHKDAHGNTIEKVKTFTDGKAYSFNMINGKLTDLYVNHIKIAPAQYAQYATEINKIKEQIRLDRIQAEKDGAQAQLDRKQADRDRVQADKDRAQAEKDREEAAVSRKQADKDQEQAVLDRAQAEKDRMQADKDREQSVKDRAQSELDRVQAEKDRAQAAIDRKQAEEDRQLMAQIITDLVKDGIVPNEKSLHSLTLSATGMTVNEKNQPNEVFERYKAKYNRFASGGFSYGSDGNGYRGIHMSRE